jgi:hypothetical protein
MSPSPIRLSACSYVNHIYHTDLIVSIEEHAIVANTQTVDCICIVQAFDIGHMQRRSRKLLNLGNDAFLIVLRKPLQALNRNVGKLY